MGEDLWALLDLDHVVDHAANCVAHRCERPPDVKQIVAELRDPQPRLLGSLLLDLVVELVDLRIDVVDDVEVRLGDGVDEAVRDHARRVRVVDGLPQRSEVVGLAAVGRRLPHRQDRVVGDHDVDLLVVDAVLLGNRAGEQEDAEDVVAVALHRRPRLVVVPRVSQDQLERRFLELPRRLRSKLVLIGIEEVDPGRGHTAADST